MKFVILARMKWHRDSEGSLASNNFHGSTEWRSEPANELGKDSILKTHLPHEGLIDSCRTLKLPAKTFARLLPDDQTRVTDGVTSDIPETTPPISLSMR